MSDNRVPISDIAGPAFDFIWRDDDSGLKLIRTVFLINYPLHILVLFCSGFNNWVLLLLFPFVAMPLQLVVSASLNHLYIRRGCDIEDKRSIEYEEFVRGRSERQVSSLGRRILSASVMSVPYWAFMSLAYFGSI
jgi:hypothetical protein